MAISLARQQGSIVIVYNERNCQIFTKAGTLYGYTGGSVTVKVGNILITYNDKGNQISTHPA